ARPKTGLNPVEPCPKSAKARTKISWRYARATRQRRSAAANGPGSINATSKDRFSLNHRQEDARPAPPHRPAALALFFLFAGIRLGLVFGGGEALEPVGEFLFGHAVRGYVGIVGIDPGPGRADERNRLGFGFVNLDIFLQRMDEFLSQVLRRNRRFGDLAKRHDGVLVVVAFHSDLRARRYQPRAVARQQNEIEPVLDLVDAIFNRDAGHRVSAPRLPIIAWTRSTAWQARVQGSRTCNH